MRNWVAKRDLPSSFLHLHAPKCTIVHINYNNQHHGHKSTPASTASETSSHYTFSPLIHQKLSMNSDEDGSDSDSENDSGIDIKEGTSSFRKHEWENSMMKQKNRPFCKQRITLFDGFIQKARALQSSNALSSQL
jgi:hypothetical protein